MPWEGSLLPIYIWGPTKATTPLLLLSNPPVAAATPAIPILPSPAPLPSTSILIN